MLKEILEKAKDLGKFTEDNLSDIEKRVQSITGESRMYLEDHFKSSKHYVLVFGSKKSYAADSWDSSKRSIESYLGGIYSGYKIQVNDAPEDNEYEWSVSVYIK